LGKLRKRDQLGDSGLDGSIILAIFKKWYIGVWIGSYWHRIGTGECGNELSGSIKCGKLLECLKT
jgi:hypothetical protein